MSEIIFPIQNPEWLIELLFLIQDSDEIWESDKIGVSWCINSLNDELERSLGFGEKEEMSIGSEGNKRRCRIEYKVDILRGVVGYIESKLLIEKKCGKGVVWNIETSQIDGKGQ